MKFRSSVLLLVAALCAAPLLFAATPAPAPAASPAGMPPQS